MNADIDETNRASQTSPTSLTEAAGLGTRPVSLETYRSQELFEKERDRIFGRAWLVVGRVEEVPQAGDFIVRDIDICSASIVITRDKSGDVRAFHNVCPHRGNQVVWERQGNQPAFVCRYHSWTFGLDGALRGVPDQRAFFNLDKSTCGLKRVTVECWEGWIFINLSKTPECSLAEFLGDFAPFLAGYDYVDADSPIVVTGSLKCNWKVVADAFSEAYHIPAIHKTTIAALFSSAKNKFGELLDAKFFGPHRFASMYGDSNYVPHEKAKIESFAFNPANFDADRLEQFGRNLQHSGVNPTKATDWVMDVNFIFPHFNIDVSAGGFWTHTFMPVSVNETRYEARFYYRKAITIMERFFQEMSLVRSIDVIFEDLSNVERTQKGINSRATDTMVLSDHEVLLRHSVKHVEKWIEAPTVREALA